MKRKIITFLFINFYLFVFASCNRTELPVKNITIEKSDGTSVSVKSEIAVTEKERNRGFMERKVIPDGTGMLFVFEKDQVLYFWMKNTPHPLSIAYISKDGIIKDIKDMTPFSLASISSSISVRYALEVPQGWYEKNGIKCGDKVCIPQL